MKTVAKTVAVALVQEWKQEPIIYVYADEATAVKSLIEEFWDDEQSADCVRPSSLDELNECMGTFHITLSTHEVQCR
jgi:hypothetical protein